MENVNNRNIGTLTKSNLFVEIGKKISYAENSLESKADILEQILPEYVGMKRVRVIISKFKEIEALKPEVHVLGKDGKTYSICSDKDGKPYFAEVKTNITDVKQQVLSIVSEYLEPEDLDEFMKKYLTAVAEITFFSDEVEEFTSEIKKLLEQLKSNQILCLDKKLCALVDKKIKQCDIITASYDCFERITKVIDEIVVLIPKIAGESIIERKYHELLNFSEEISKAIDKMTLTENDHYCLTDLVQMDMVRAIKRLNVLPDFTPEGFKYLDGKVQDNNYRMYASEAIRRYIDGRSEKMVIVKWISGRTLSNGTYVKGFYVTYAVYSDSPWWPVSQDTSERYDTFDEFKSNKWQGRLSQKICGIFTRDFYGFKFITEEQYRAVYELNEELGEDVIKLWPAWIVSRVKEVAYNGQKLIEKRDGELVIIDSPEGSWNVKKDYYSDENEHTTHAIYLVID